MDNSGIFTDNQNLNVEYNEVSNNEVTNNATHSVNNNINGNTNQLKNLNILVNGIKLAQKRGAFEVHESAILWEAISSFLSEQPDTSDLLN